MDRRHSVAIANLETLRSRLISVAYRVVRDRTEAEEICDECLSRWMAESKSAPPLQSPEAWMTRVALRLAVDRARSWARQRPLPLSAAASTSTQEPGPLASAVAVERRERIWRAVLALPDRQREVLVLHQMEGLKYSEIGNILNIQESTARAQSHAARETLRRKLKSLQTEIGEPDEL